MRKNWELFITFFKLGCVTFGGGMAMMPLMQKEACDKKKWATKDEIVDFYALAQTVPGIIAANVATMVGHKVNGFWGAFWSLLGMITPSIIVICVIASVLHTYNEVLWIKHALMGINIAVLVLLLGLLISMRHNLFDFLTVLIALAAFILISFFNVSPSLVILGAAVLGVLFYRKKVTKV